MKTNLLSNTLSVLCLSLTGAALAVSFLLPARAQVPIDPYLRSLPVVERIEQTPVFRDPIVYIGDQAPDLAESADLWTAIEVLSQQGPRVGIPALELFAQAYSNSVWTPSLQNNLGYYYRNKGRYSLALHYWGSAWDATKLAEAGRAKEVADFALAHLTRLLASLGWSEELEQILQGTWGRALDAGPLQQIFEVTKASFVGAKHEPQAAYRCGAYALSRVAQVLQPGNANIPYLAEIPSQRAGFSLSALKTMADQAGLRLVAVQRLGGQDLVVPAVVHWRVDHYAAITARDGNWYKVEDSALEQPIWMDLDTINAEASGYFLIPANQQRAGWTALSPAQADQIIGRGPLVVIVVPNGINDEDPESCPTGEDGDEDADPTNPANEGDAGDPAEDCQTCNNSGGPDDAPNDAGCSGCSDLAYGMPLWKVAEPYINLWILDRPTFYTKSYGKRQVFKLMYKQRNTRTNPFGFGFGSFWECNRLAYFYQDSAKALKHYVPGGGTRTYADGTPEYKSGTHSSTTTDGSGNCTSVSLTAPNAAVNNYSYVFDHLDETRDIYLSTQVDRYGRTTFYNYATVGGKVHLTSIADHDGRSTLFAYGNASFPNVITQVTDPWGHSVQLRYDTSGRLTNIVDAIPLSSSFVYDDTTGWITNLVTPYGTTVFQLTGTASSFINDPTYAVNRSCTVTEPNGSKQLFVYRRNANQLNPGNSTILINTTWPAAEIPTLPYANTLNTSTPEMHNSFYWNRQQYAALNATFRGSGNFNDLTVADYKLPRRRHWLTKYDNSLLSGTLSVQRDPSPDGTTLGATVWYDYVGKLADYREGSDSFPLTVARVLPNGQTAYRNIQRNSVGRPTLIASSYGDGSTSRNNQLFYYANNRDLQYELGPAGQVLRGYTYNANHQVLTFTNAEGDVTSYVYDGLKRISQMILPAGVTSTFTYGADGFVSQVADQPINRTRSFTYLSSFVYRPTDDRGMAITNYWDNLQRLTGVLYPDGTISNVYTRLDVTASKDRLGFWTYFGYNELRQKTAETNANNVITLYGYCECGAPSAITRAYGTSLQDITLFNYDLQGHRTGVVYPDTTSLSFKYDSMGRLTNRVDALSSTTYWYNNQSLLTAVSNTLGQLSLTIYDINDRATGVTDANGVTVTQTFDNLGRVLTRTYPDSGVERFGYSARGLTKYTNQLDQVTSYGYDEAGRRVAETNANTEILRYTYNAAGDLKTLTDGKTQVTTWNYDEFGRVTNKLDQASVEILRYKYDANSRLTNRWSAAKGTNVYFYDAVGNLTLVDYPSGTTDITLQYDALNRLTNMVDAAGTTKYTYYAGGLLATEDGPWASDTVTYSYNNARLRSGLSLQQPTGTWTNGFLYDAGRRLASVTFSPGTFTYSYKVGQASSLPIKLLLPNTAYITNTYDNVARLTGTYLDNSSNTVLDKSEYLYNTNSQRIRLTRTDGSYYTNIYDNIGQLKWADSTVASEDRGYLYDAAWNLNKRTNNGVASTFTVDGKNQLTSVAGSTYTYDSNGNLTGAGSWVYDYDAENQLRSVTLPSTQKTDFVYDGRGRLRKRSESIWTNSTWQVSSETRYIYDGMRVIQERDTSNTPTVSYTRGSDLSESLEGAGGIGGLLARSHGYSAGSWTTNSYYHADGGGNITMLVDGTQVTVASYRYDPYGNTISSSGSLAAANVYRFSSKELIVNWGLYYYGYRFYDAILQRWLNRDPISELGGINLYAYVGSSPLNIVDPFGLAEYPPDFVGPLQPGDYRLPPFQPINPSTRNALSKYFGDKNPDHLKNIPDDELSKARDNAGRACEKYEGQGRTPDKFYDLQKERQKLLDDVLRNRQGPQPSPRPGPPWWQQIPFLRWPMYIPTWWGPGGIPTPEKPPVEA